MIAFFEPPEHVILQE